MYLKSKPNKNPTFFFYQCLTFVTWLKNSIQGVIFPSFFFSLFSIEIDSKGSWFKFIMAKHYWIRFWLTIEEALYWWWTVSLASCTNFSLPSHSSSGLWSLNGYFVFVYILLFLFLARMLQIGPNEDKIPPRKLKFCSSYVGSTSEIFHVIFVFNLRIPTLPKPISNVYYGISTQKKNVYYGILAFYWTFLYWLIIHE